MNSTTNIVLNLQYPNIAQVAYAMQGDRLSRSVVASLVDGDTPWTPPAGAYGLITASKPDGTFAVYDTLEDGSPAIVIDGSTVTLYLAEQVLADAGAVKMSVAFFTSAGARLTTFRWTEVVAPEAVMDRVVSGNYISILTATMAEAAQIFDQIKAAYGAPRVAATAAAMTDHNLIYVYTGSESGYTAGHWYYWDGTAWADGGNYNSTGLTTDTTLTVAGAAADAKATGDQVSDLKSANSYVPTLPAINVPFPNGITYTENMDGSITANGTATNRSRCYQWQYTDGFPDGIKAGDKILCVITTGEPINLTGMIVLRVDGVSQSQYIRDNTVIEIPANASGITIGVSVDAGKTVNNETIGFYVVVLPQLEKNVFDNYAAEINTRLNTAFSEINAANAEITNRIIKNVLLTFGDFSTKTSGGLTYTWDSAHEKCTVTGTTTAAVSFDALWLYTSGLPAEIKPGRKYDIQFTSTKETPDVSFKIYYRASGSGAVNSFEYYGDTTIEIPANCDGITIRLNVNGSGKTVNETITLSMHENFTTSSGGNDVARMYSIGSSFMTGAIYPTGNTGGLDHICSFENSPWGNVAIGLGIPESNCVHRLVSSTGLLYDAGYGSILSILKQTDLSSFDYILTQYNRPDLGTSTSKPGFPLGDLSSSAGDGTIIGAILDLLAYMRTNAPNATLILIGAPPSDQRDEYSGQYVFTAKYQNGSSIGEADMMISKLAAREHFIFIGWEDLNLSYYYRSLCYGDGNVHPTDDATCRAMGLYLARQCNYNTAIAKALQADL